MGRFHKLLVVLIIAAISDRLSAQLPRGRIIADSVYLVKGKPLNASCILEGDQVNIAKVSARNITFHLREKNLRKRYIRVVNDTYATLFYPNTRSSSSGQLHCRIGEQNIYSIYVDFGYEPWKPENVTVEVNNWTDLLIKWVKKKNKIYMTDTTAYWRHSSFSATWFHECKKKDDSAESFQCQTSLPPNITDGYFIVKAGASNIAGKTMSDEKIAYFRDIVVPGAVKHLQVIEVASHWAKVRWEAPSMAGPLDYIITHNCSRSHPITKENVTYGGPEATHTKQLDDLHPYTLCEISVRAKSVDSQRLGPASNVSNRTEEAVPSGHPEVVQGGFELTPLGESTKRTLVLYWKRLPEEYQNGPLTNYIVYEDKNPVKAGPSAYCQTFHLNSTATYQFYVKASNVKGENKTAAETIKIPSQSEVPEGPQNVTAIISRNFSSAVVAWSIKWGPNVSYVVFWSKGYHRRICREEIQWETGIAQPPWNLVLPPGENVRNYHVGVSMTMGRLSSGIKWVDCIHRQFAESRPPSVTMQSLTVDSIELVLIKPTSCDDRPGLIYAYFIQYCMGATEHCFGSSVNVTVAVLGGRTPYEISGLREGKPYQLRVYSLTSGATLHKFVSTNFTTAVLFGGVHTWGWIVIAVIVSVISLLCCCIGIISVIRCNRRLVTKLLEGTQQVQPPQQAQFESPCENNSDFDAESIQILQRDVQTPQTVGEDCLLFDSLEKTKLSGGDGNDKGHQAAYTTPARPHDKLPMPQQDAPEARHQAPAVYTTPVLPHAKLPMVLGRREWGCGASGDSGGSYAAGDLLNQGHRGSAKGRGVPLLNFEGRGNPLLKQAPVYNIPPTDPLQCPDQQNLENLKKGLPLQESRVVQEARLDKRPVQDSPAWPHELRIVQEPRLDKQPVLDSAVWGGEPGPEKPFHDEGDGDSDSDSSCPYSSTVHIMARDFGLSVKHDEADSADGSGSPNIYTPAVLTGCHRAPEHMCGSDRRTSADGTSEGSSSGYSSNFLLHTPCQTHDRLSRQLSNPPLSKVHAADEVLQSHAANKPPPSELALLNMDSSGESDDCGYATTDFKAL